jgi:hypothetical protein
VGGLHSFDEPGRDGAVQDARLLHDDLLRPADGQHGEDLGPVRPAAAAESVEEGRFLGQVAEETRGAERATGESLEQQVARLTREKKEEVKRVAVQADELRTLRRRVREAEGGEQQNK